MKAIKYFTCIVLLALTSRIYSQIPDTVWTKTFGGALADVGNSVKQTNDGGFIVAATSSSFGAGGQDIWLIKTNENGDTLWTKTFGGTANDRASNVVQTNDNGFAIFGTTNSFGNGGDDYIIWKTDWLGITEWFETFGTGSNEIAVEGRQTSDGGYILTGYFYSQNYKTWTIKTDNIGQEIWDRIITSSSSNYYAYSMTQTTDSGYVICGTWFYWYSGSYRYNYFLIKYSSVGELAFTKYYEFTGRDVGTNVREIGDGNLILGGVTENLTENQRTRLIKVSPFGNIIWNKIVMGSRKPVYPTSLEVTQDNGFIFSLAATGGLSAIDFQIIKTDEIGTLAWEYTIGGNAHDSPYSVYPTNDEGFIVTGQTNSFGVGDFDIWLLKFKYDPSPEIQVSKDSLNLTFDGISFTSGDSLIIYNTGNMTLNIDTIYSTNASGFILDIILKDTTIHSAVTWRTSYYNPFEIEPNDSAKLIFTYPLWIPNSLKTTETWMDTIVILNNSLNNSSLKIPAVIDFPVGISDESNDLPEKFALSQNYPNPFNPVTSIQYAVSSRQFVTLKVYDVLGTEIAILVNEEKQPGTYEVEFNTSSIKHLPSSGIYFYQLRAGNYIETKKMVLLK